MKAHLLGPFSYKTDILVDACFCGPLIFKGHYTLFATL